ncbi:hypothetical protein [Actinokineospora sp.]|uniref:hypothetical protein n=1 Tax=Actinokineospora sp. TaxID=1872133 RepID=UPI004037926B
MSLLVAALVGAGLLVGGGVAGYFIGDAGDGRPGHARYEQGPRGGPLMDRGGPGGRLDRGPRPPRRAIPQSPPSTSPTSTTQPTTTQPTTTG